MADEATGSEVGLELHENFKDFWHDVDFFISDVTKLAGLTDNQIQQLPILQQRIQSISGLALSVSAKNSFLKYITAEKENEPLEHFTSELSPAIYRCAKALQRVNRLYNKTSTIKISRASHSSYRGPFFFDFIPFAILDNAVKYNIYDRDIAVKTYDEGEFCIAEFASWGPVIAEDEMQRVFEKEYRGRSVLSGSFEGRGLGLYHARLAIRDYFGGDITVSTTNEPTFGANNVEYSKHAFRIKLPKATVV